MSAGFHLLEGRNLKKQNKTPFLAALVELHGFKAGTSNKETADNYKSVLNIPNTKPDQRLIVCKDGIQIIHQHFYAGRWRSLAYYASQTGCNRGLVEVSGFDGASPAEASKRPAAKALSAGKHGASKSEGVN